MTTAVIDIPRERVVLDGGESTAPLPVARPEPLAPLQGRHRLDFRRFVDPMSTVTVRELLARDVVWSGRLGRRRAFAPWVTFVLLAIVVPLLFAVLAGCTPEPDAVPSAPVSGESPDPTVPPFVPAWVAGDMPALGEFPIGGAP